MRCGLVGWACRTGNGQMNRDLWDMGLVQKWLVPRHPILDYELSVLPAVEDGSVVTCEREGDDDVYSKFLDDIDTLLFVEAPSCVSGFDLVAECNRRGIVTCCIPMMEWLPLHPWVADVDVMWAPTQWSKDELEHFAYDFDRKCGKLPRWVNDGIVGGRWGVDVDRFVFRERARADLFLYPNGNGGASARKGSLVVGRAAELAPEVPILFRSQRYQEIPLLTANVTLAMDNCESKWSVYDVGDVLLAPSRWEGLGHSLYEAQACGLPVITTLGPPMDECSPLQFVSAKCGRYDLCGRGFTTWEADPFELAKIIRELHGQDIREASRSARKFVESHHDLRDVVRDLRSELEGRVF